MPFNSADAAEKATPVRQCRLIVTHERRLERVGSLIQLDRYFMKIEKRACRRIVSLEDRFFHNEKQLGAVAAQSRSGRSLHFVGPANDRPHALFHRPVVLDIDAEAGIGLAPAGDGDAKMFAVTDRSDKAGRPYR